jgi:outer membrane protein
MRLSRLFVLLPLLARPLLAQAPPAGRLSLDSAIAFALKNNPSYLQSLNNATVDAANERLNEARFFPTFAIGVSTNGGPSRSATPLTVKTSSNSSTSLSASLSYDIIDGGRRRASLNSARNGTVRNQVSLESQLIALRSTVTLQYYQAQQTDRAIALQQRQLDASRANLDLTNKKLRIATAAPLDVKQAELAVLDAEQLLRQAQDDARKAKLTLVQTLGVSGAPSFDLDTVVPLPIDPSTLDETRLVSSALTSSPTVRANELALDAQRISTRLTRSSRWWPTISTNASFGRSQSASDFTAFGVPFPKNSVLSLGVTARYNLPEWFSSSYSVTQSDAGLEDQEYAMRGVRISIERQVRAAFIDFQNAFASLANARRQAELARQTLDIAQEQLRSGTMTYVTFQQIVDRAASAERNALVSQFNVLTRQRALEDLIGGPLRP